MSRPLSASASAAWSASGPRWGVAFSATAVRGRSKRPQVEDARAQRHEGEGISLPLVTPAGGGGLRVEVKDGSPPAPGLRGDRKVDCESCLARATLLGDQGEGIHI